MQEGVFKGEELNSDTPTTTTKIQHGADLNVTSKIPSGLLDKCLGTKVNVLISELVQKDKYGLS